MAIKLIRQENFAQEVIAEKKPVLLLIMPWDDQLSQQLKLLENIAGRYNEELKVAVLEKESIEAIKRSYGVLGTPTFLLLVEGKERGRMLGLANQEMLINLISHL